MKTSLLILFIVMCLAQWFVPGKMVYDSEIVVREGTVFKFKTEPIDPSDPFRGKYITLNFKDDFIEVSNGSIWQQGQQIFVSFTTDSSGFVVPESISGTQPETESFLRTTIDNISNYEGVHKVWFKLPFTKFYLEESKASQAEQLYWQAQRDSAQIAYAVVNIKDGQAVLKDVIINDKSIVDIINLVNEK